MTRKRGKLTPGEPITVAKCLMCGMGDHVMCVHGELDPLYNKPMTCECAVKGHRDPPGKLIQEALRR